MSRFFQAGRKAKAEIEKRKVFEQAVNTPESDNDSIVAERRPIGERPKRNRWMIEMYKQHKDLCECCGWRPPTPELLHAHHIVPVSCGGADREDNLVILCPNCHAVAHYVAPRTNLQRQYSGPTTATALLHLIGRANNPNELKRLQRARMLGGVLPILAEMRA